MGKRLWKLGRRNLQEGVQGVDLQLEDVTPHPFLHSLDEGCNVCTEFAPPWPAVASGVLGRGKGGW